MLSYRLTIFFFISSKLKRVEPRFPVATQFNPAEIYFCIIGHKYLGTHSGVVLYIFFYTLSLLLVHIFIQ